MDQTTPPEKNKTVWKPLEDFKDMPLHKQTTPFSPNRRGAPPRQQPKNMPRSSSMRSHSSGPPASQRGRKPVSRQSSTPQAPHKQAPPRVQKAPLIQKDATQADATQEDVVDSSKIDGGEEVGDLAQQLGELEIGSAKGAGDQEPDLEPEQEPLSKAASESQVAVARPSETVPYMGVGSSRGGSRGRGGSVIGRYYDFHTIPAYVPPPVYIVHLPQSYGDTRFRGGGAFSKAQQPSHTARTFTRAGGGTVQNERAPPRSYGRRDDWQQQQQASYNGPRIINPPQGSHRDRDGRRPQQQPQYFQQPVANHLPKGYVMQSRPSLATDDFPALPSTMGAGKQTNTGAGSVVSSSSAVSTTTKEPHGAPEQHPSKWMSAVPPGFSAQPPPGFATQPPPGFSAPPPPGFAAQPPPGFSAPPMQLQSHAMMCQPMQLQPHAMMGPPQAMVPMPMQPLLMGPQMFVPQQQAMMGPPMQQVGAPPLALSVGSRVQVPCDDGQVHEGTVLEIMPHAHACKISFEQFESKHTVSIGSIFPVVPKPLQPLQPPKMLHSPPQMLQSRPPQVLQPPSQ